MRLAGVCLSEVPLLRLTSWYAGPTRREGPWSVLVPALAYQRREGRGEIRPCLSRQATRAIAVERPAKTLQQGRPALFGMVLCNGAQNAEIPGRAVKAVTGRPSLASGQVVRTFGGRPLRRR